MVLKVVTMRWWIYRARAFIGSHQNPIEHAYNGNILQYNKI